jgi:hypothetical protein
VLLHVRLSKADEAVGKRRLKLCDFSKFGNGNIELSLFVGYDSGLHVLGGFR